MFLARLKSALRVQAGCTCRDEHVSTGLLMNAPNPHRAEPFLGGLDDVFVAAFR